MLEKANFAWIYHGRYTFPLYAIHKRPRDNFVLFSFAVVVVVQMCFIIVVFFVSLISIIIDFIRVTMHIYLSYCFFLLVFGSGDVSFITCEKPISIRSILCFNA